MKHDLLVEKYGQVIGTKTLKEFDFGGGAGGGEASSAGGEASESNIAPGEPEVALDWKNAGLFEPETPEENSQTQAALNELKAICHQFEKNLEGWQRKHTKIGSQDTVSREQVAQYIAKGVLGLKMLD